MKKIFTLLLLLPLLTFAQKKQKDVSKVMLPMKDKSIYYERVIDSLSGTKKDVYNASIKWMATVFVDSKEVIQHKNDVDGTIIGSGYVKLYIPGFISTNELISFMIEIATKDNKSRIRLYQFSQKAIGYNYPFASMDQPYQTYLSEITYPKMNRKYYEAFNDQIELLIASYSNYLKQNTKPDDF